MSKLRNANIDFDSHSSNDVNNSLDSSLITNFIQFFMVPMVLLVGSLYLIRRFEIDITNLTNNPANIFRQKSNVNEFIMNVDTGIRFENVAGIDEIRAEIEEVVTFLKKPEKFTRVGAKIPRGVLLVGPPGTGKTLLAKAIAGEAKVPFVSIAGSEFVEMYVGLGASRVRKLFKNAKAKAPCIIFIDEIDAIGKKRGGRGGGNDEREQTLNQLLTEMDGFAGNTGIILIAATNRIDVLDAALIRPGRFDRQITVNLPDANGRLDILKVHAANKKFDKNVSFTKIAQRTVGFAGADLANVLNEAAILATRRKNQMILVDDINTSIERIIRGLEGTSLRDGKSKRLVAYHEVGHAIVATFLPEHPPVEKLTLIPRGQAPSSTWFTQSEDPELMSQEQILSRIIGSLGGRAAEQIIFGTTELTTIARNDVIQATRIARQMVMVYGMSNVGPMAFQTQRKPFFMTNRPRILKTIDSADTASKIDMAVQEILGYAYKEALRLVDQNRDAVNHLANSLIERENLDGSEFRETLSKYTKLPIKKEYISYFDRKIELNKEIEVKK
jgi:cell division protease FtsH